MPAGNVEFFERKRRDDRSGVFIDREKAAVRQTLGSE
jgi:hypothetical protein